MSLSWTKRMSLRRRTASYAPHLLRVHNAGNPVLVLEPVHVSWAARLCPCGGRRVSGQARGTASIFRMVLRTHYESVKDGVEVFTARRERASEQAASVGIRT
jgi:hypothetical protein